MLDRDNIGCPQDYAGKNPLPDDVIGKLKDILRRADTALTLY